MYVNCSSGFPLITVDIIVSKRYLDWNEYSFATLATNEAKDTFLTFSLDFPIHSLKVRNVRWVLMIKAMKKHSQESGELARSVSLRLPDLHSEL